MSRFTPTARIAALAAFLVNGSANAQTPMQWGIDKSASPYAFSALVGGSWRQLGTVTSGGTWALPSSNLTYTQSGTGAATNTIQARLRDNLIATDFTGVDTTGVADSTAGLVNAFAQMASSGKALFFPCGTYKLSGSGTEVFLVTNKSVNIVGEGKECVVLNTSGVGATTDIIHHVFTTSWLGSNVSGMGQAGTGGRAFYKLDVGTTGFLYGLNFTNNLIPGVDANGVAISLNAGASAPGGALAYSTIANNFTNAIYCAYCGDNITISNNYLSGTHTAIEMSYVSGAANTTVERNVIVNSGGMVLFHNGVHNKVIFNEFEAAVADTSPNGALINFAGDTATIYGGEVFGNSVSVLDAAGNPGPDIVRINAAENVSVDGNRLSLYRHGGYHIVTTASSLRNNVGYGNKWDTVATAAVVPYIYNGGGYNFGCAPNFTAPASTTVLHGDSTYGCGSFSAIAVGDLPSVLSPTTTIGSLPTCVVGLLGSVYIVSNGTAYGTGTYGSAVSATGAVTRKVFCTNTGGPTTYAWAYN